MSDILYCIKCSTDTAKIGMAFPQTDGMGGCYNLSDQDSVWNISNFSEIDFSPKLDYFNIDKRAILTDFLSTALISSAGFLINDRARNLLDNFTLTKHAYYQATIKYKNKMLNNYYWLHFTSCDDDLIDFDRSTFILTEPLRFFRTQVVDIRDHSKSEVFEIIKKSGSLVLFPNELVFKSHPRQDLYSFSFLHQTHYINEPFREMIISENISGIDIYLHDFSFS
jgi:hypothetical protein